MNGEQQYKKNKDYSRINLIKQIQVLENYRGYKRILFLRPFSNTYLGYLDSEFFGFTVREGENIKLWLMEAKDAINHYLDKTFFHDPSLEYNTFYSKPLYHPFVVALKYKLDKGIK